MRKAVAAQGISNLHTAAFHDRIARGQPSLLGALCFSAEGTACREEDMPHLRVCMRRLDGGNSHCETWHGRGQLVRGHRGDIQYCHDSEILFGVLALPESRFVVHNGKAPLQQAAEQAYREVFTLVDELGFRYYYRFWNYFPDINQMSHGLERYRQFNLGRQDAFGRHGYVEADGFPAACALGSSQGPLCVAFLAGQAAPHRIENPRQVSAYHYPEQYGPRTPLFSRATLMRSMHEDVLLISGTASVVGHATLHPDNVAAQARETIANIGAVLAEANRVSRRAAFRLPDLSCRVYVRNAADLPQVQAALTQSAGATLNAAYLQADICRKDLLLEIEATGVVTPDSFAGGAEG
jgi:enamine deaminase RidA (YjgF/YER057c/UK114 family)